MHALRYALVLTLAFLSGLHAATAPSLPSGRSLDGFAFVKQVGGIAEYWLPANDLGVLLLEDHSAPVLTFMVTCEVRSRNEVTGTTGAAHLIGHLMFTP